MKYLNSKSIIKKILFRLVVFIATLILLFSFNSKQVKAQILGTCTVFNSSWVTINTYYNVTEGFCRDFSRSNWDPNKIEPFVYLMLNNPPQYTFEVAWGMDVAYFDINMVQATNAVIKSYGAIGPSTHEFVLEATIDYGYIYLSVSPGAVRSAADYRITNDYGEAMTYYSNDTSAPDIYFTPNGYSYGNHTEIEVITTDYGTGVSRMGYYWTTNSSSTRPSIGNFTMINNINNVGYLKYFNQPGEGVYYLWIYSQDVRGNARYLKSNAFKKDIGFPTLTTLNLIDEQTTMNYSQGTWTNHNVVVEFYCSDSISGMKKCDLYNGSTLLKSFTSGGYHILTSDINSSSIRIRMEDNAGNVSYSSYRTIRIDKTSPVLNYITFYDYVTADTLEEGVWTNGSVVIDYYCVDSGSGIKSCELYDGSSKLSATLMAPSMYLVEQEINTTSLRLRMEDNSGNVSYSSYKPLRIDKTPPTLNYITLYNHSTLDYYQEGTWTNSGVVVDYYCVDAGSAIKSCEVYNGSTKIEAYEVAPSMYLIDQEINSSYIRLRMEDNAGNVSYSTYKTIRIDKTVNKATINISNSNSLEFKVDKDAKSGLKDIFIIVNGNELKKTIPSNYDTYQTYFTPQLFGEYELGVKVVDLAGNVYETPANDLHKISHFDPNPYPIDIEIEYGPDLGGGEYNSHTVDIVNDPNNNFVSVLNDGSNPSKINLAISNVYRQLFGISNFDNLTFKYRIKNDTTPVLNNSISIPPLEDCSAIVINAYETCGRVDKVTLVVETGDGVKVNQIITIISLNIMPVTIKGVDNFNYILNVGQSFTLDKIEFIDSNKKKIEETNVEDIIEFEGEVVDSIDTNRVGTYKVTTMAKDETGVMSRPIVRHVVVADTLPPSISLIGEELVSLRKGEIYLDEGSIAIDNVDGIVYVTGENKVNYNRVGTYEITYYYIDSSGIRSEVITRIIRVEQDYFKLAIYGLLASTITGLLIVFTRKEKQSYKNNLLI